MISTKFKKRVLAFFFFFKDPNRLQITVEELKRQKENKHLICFWGQMYDLYLAVFVSKATCWISWLALPLHSRVVPVFDPGPLLFLWSLIGLPVLARFSCWFWRFRFPICYKDKSRGLETPKIVFSCAYTCDGLSILWSIITTFSPMYQCMLG